eukprot:m.679073 g.679073  ORF g.679073 m.679073 type:complete len:529 (-) comp22810_c0_seq6:2435-4021(-)
MPATCPACGASDIETDSARGSQVCTRCGMVLEDNIIISEVQFSESGGGASSVVGQSVGADGSKPFSSMLSSGFHSGYSRDSRMMTIDNGRKAIASLAASLSLHAHHIDSAHRYFKLAVEHRFIQGRKTEFVVAACLYIVCRYEKTSHMLLDFADALQVNVFTLGSIYLKLIRRLNIRGMPIIDPSLYMLRFANKMGFEDKTHEVGRTALRLVARMKRDWIQVGRRPSGICGAGLLIAARLHGFSRTQKEIIKVVRICESTLRKRLEEFEDTPSSELTTKQFMQIDLEGEADPPAFAQARKRARLDAALAITASAARDSQGDILSNPDVLKEMESMAQSMSSLASTEADPHQRMAQARGSAASVATAAVPLPVSGDGSVAASLAQAVAAASTAAAKNTSGDAVNAVDKDDEELTDLSDDEVSMFILADDEVKVKSELWQKENADYLEKQRMREEQEAYDREHGIVKADPKKRKKKRDRPARAPTTPGEAVQQMLEKKKTSSKINYAVLKGLGIGADEDDTPTNINAVVA